MEIIEKLHVDQAVNRTDVYDRNITSFYTPYGIKAIDGNFCARIRNINSRVKRAYQIRRRPGVYYHYKTGEACKDSFSYDTHYDEIDPHDLRIGFGVRVEWENGSVKDFLNGGNDVLPNINFVTKRDNPQTLWMEIEHNPHLHDKIKENLLNNLENIYSND